MAGSLLLPFVLWNIILYFVFVLRQWHIAAKYIHSIVVWVLFALFYLSLHLITALLLYGMDIHTAQKQTSPLFFSCCFLFADRKRATKVYTNIPLWPFCFPSAARFFPFSPVCSGQPATKSVRIGQRTRFLAARSQTNTRRALSSC